VGASAGVKIVQQAREARQRGTHEPV